VDDYLKFKKYLLLKIDFVDSIFVKTQDVFCRHRKQSIRHTNVSEPDKHKAFHNKTKRSEINCARPQLKKKIVINTGKMRRLVENNKKSRPGMLVMSEQNRHV
jgi:hypothetical protein